MMLGPSLLHIGCGAFATRFTCYRREPIGLFVRVQRLSLSAHAADVLTWEYAYCSCKPILELGEHF